MASTFARASADVPSRHTSQYFEMMGHRGMYVDGWKAVTRHDEGTGRLGLDVDVACIATTITDTTPPSAGHPPPESTTWLGRTTSAVTGIVGGVASTT
jgi:arylsulfatase A-like enzyme